MQREDPDTALDDAQASVAGSGLKGLIPVGRPFLDFVLTAVADAGYTSVCIVIGPTHDAIRTYYGQELETRRLDIEFAVQPEPLGTANAVVAAEAFAGSDPFLVINSDNYYPPDTLEALRGIPGCGLIAYERDALVASSNIPEERIARFAILQTENGYLQKIIEKPSPEVIAAQPRPIYVSMNCWRFDADAFQACRAIDPSPRGEYEIPDAVEYLMTQRGLSFRALPFRSPVLDLTSRADIPAVSEMVGNLRVDL